MQTQLICAYLTVHTSLALYVFYINIFFLYVCAYVYLPHIYLYLIIESLSFVLFAYVSCWHALFSILCCLSFFLQFLPILLMVPSNTHTYYFYYCSYYNSMNTNRKERGISDACRTICAICDYNLHV